MTQPIKVTASDLHSVSSQLSSGSGDTESPLGALHAQVQGLVDGGRQGSASGAFIELYTPWHTSAGRLKRALDGIARQLASAATTYEQALTSSLSA